MRTYGMRQRLGTAAPSPTTLDLLLLLLPPAAVVVRAAAPVNNCGQAGEGGNLHGKPYPREVTLDCGGDQIAGITFANYGLPVGECGGGNALLGTGGSDTFHKSDHCSVDGGTVAYTHCVGKTTCTIDCGPVNGPNGGNKVFQKDPCVGTTKHCAIVVQCPHDPCVANPALCAFVDDGPDASGWGWTFILLLLLGVGMYAGGGLAWNIKRRGMPLVRTSLPHYEFWVSTRALVMDGSTFTRQKLLEAKAKY
jgi:hypothetical protein